MPKKSIEKPIKVLLEMRPALEGFAGIPQETRLLFRGLRLIEKLDVEGLIQTSHRVLAKGTKDEGFFFASLPEHRKINRYSRVIISVAEKPFRTIFDRLLDWGQKGVASTELTIGTLFGIKSIKLTNFESKHFHDFVWRTFFSKTLPASDFALVATANQKICSVPWSTMHRVGLGTLNIFSRPRYPRLDTKGIDIFLAQTPYPARVDRRTAFVVRYHDAIPVLMPHTISDKSMHQATHFYALMSNVNSGAYFACVSEVTRQDLIKIFPEAERRAVTIHNMVSHHYFNEESSNDRVPGIIRTRLHGEFEDETKAYGLVPKFLTIRERENFYGRKLESKPLKYLLVVSTIEPRKNHTRLLAAWEVIKADIDKDIKLVVVGTLGWDYKQVVKGLRPWIDRGEVFMLSSVPAPDLRVLYKHAMATVCPSLGEGFDFSGVEAMRSGGVVVASDIAVHREVYDDAADYFDPYSTVSLVKSLRKVLYDQGADQVREQLRMRGESVSERYLPDRILPKWRDFVNRVISEHEIQSDDRRRLSQIDAPKGHSA
jgi:glycosyltransferase involved in cell wall biosynthesis